MAVKVAFLFDTHLASVTFVWLEACVHGAHVVGKVGMPSTVCLTSVTLIWLAAFMYCVFVLVMLAAVAQYLPGMCHTHEGLEPSCPARL